jgi:hypothetical protein
VDDLERLAALITQLNAVNDQIAHLIGYPAHPGHIAEYVTAAVFDVALNTSKSHKGTDGIFRTGPCCGTTVNIKYKTKRDGGLDLSASVDPTDYPAWYLVLTGPTSGAGTSRDTSAPWVIQEVFLFGASDLLHALSLRGRRPGGIQPGIAASVHSALWHAAMIYPDSHNMHFVITDAQRRALSLFGG